MSWINSALGKWPWIGMTRLSTSVHVFVFRWHLSAWIDRPAYGPKRLHITAHLMT